MQTHVCRIKLDAVRRKSDKTGEHLSMVRVAIYVVYLIPMHSAIQHKESNPNTLMPKDDADILEWAVTFTGSLNNPTQFVSGRGRFIFFSNSIYLG